MINEEKKRDYPLFLIDRSKPKNYPSDYVVCLDREVGFVAKVVHFTSNEMYSAFLDKFHNIENKELAGIYMPLKTGGLVLTVVDFLYFFEVNNDTKCRVHTLLKKALKKYIHAEVDRTPDIDNFGIENQIKQQKLTIERAKQNYGELIKRSSDNKEIADYQIALAEATLKTLENYRDSMKFFTISLN
ncbi:MAG: hypothetical protein FWF72_01730 [Paludibacter sp.]|nr:hypothetical protein [Paludibacter sp.]